VFVEIKRIKTGICGFDKLVKGGFPSASTILLTGSPGTGKTIFALQFLYNGAVKFRERGLYITFEQNEEALKDQAKLFGWDLERMIKNKMLQLIHVPAKRIDHKTANMIVKKVIKERIRRLVIDSISTMSVNAPIYTFMTYTELIDMEKGKSFSPPSVNGSFIVKRFIYSFIDDLRSVDHCTTILVSESPEKGEYLSRDTISEFVCDGVIQIMFESMGGEFSRSLIIRKMRYTKNDEDVHPLEIKDKEGLIIHSIEK
jgi:KaiC/GvpD/RAD55 family RecA-like ATPase